MHIISNHRFLASAAIVLSLAGCATHNPHQRAPIEDRNRPVGSAGGSAAAPVVPRVLPGAENAGKPGYYTVKPGDTLIRVSLETGQNWRDLSAWNNLENPNLIEVGQVLRVVAPDANAAAGATTTGTKPIAAPSIQARAIDPRTGASSASSAASGTAVKPGASSATTASAASGTTTASQASTPEVKDPKDTKDTDEINWQWPANGPLLGGFEEGKRKGLVIGGKAGDPVFAAADGHVVYAGSGLRGYGNLVIIKHNAEYLTAYAHNQTLLVKEDQRVRKGQKIAEMGSTDAERVQLHFEIRKQGKPVDPARQLPTR